MCTIYQASNRLVLGILLVALSFLTAPTITPVWLLVLSRLRGMVSPHRSCSLVPHPPIPERPRFRVKAALPFFTCASLQTANSARSTLSPQAAAPSRKRLLTRWAVDLCAHDPQRLSC